jgi:putative oxidoreductase
MSSGSEEGNAVKSNVAYALQIVAGGLFVAAGAAKLAGADIMVQEFDLVGLGQSARILVGLIEIIGGLCLVVPRAGVLGATLVACTVVGFLSAAYGVSSASRPSPTSGPLLIYESSQTPAEWTRRGDGQASRQAVRANALDI